MIAQTHMDFQRRPRFFGRRLRLAQSDGRKGCVQQAQPPTAIPACLCRSHGRQAAPALQDWPPQKDQTWRIIDAMDARGLSAFYKKHRADGKGQAAFEPSMRVALLLYAYSLGVLPRAARENVSAQTQPSNARKQKRVAILPSFWSSLSGHFLS